MAARFKVRRSAALSERGLFVLAGVIEEGMVRTGMVARLSAEEKELFAEPVHGVEFMALDDEGSGPALTFHYREEEKLRRWQELHWEGAVLELEY